MNLRQLIIAEIKRHHNQESEGGVKIPEYCTWWFKSKIDQPTKVFRKELLKMEREGLVIANREQSNNTKWRLKRSATAA